MWRTQLNLFGDEVVADSDSQKRFLKYHEDNPHIYEALRDSALRLRRAGWRQYGMKGVFEHLRFRSDVSAVASAWKLNNDFTSRYARLLMEQEPELDGFFKLRRLQS